MNAEMHVIRSLKAIVVELDVGVEHLVCGLVVALICCPAFQHILRALEERIRLGQYLAQKKVQSKLD